MRLHPETIRRHRQRCLLNIAIHTLAPDPEQHELKLECYCADCKIKHTNEEGGDYGPTAADGKPTSRLEQRR